MAHRLSAGDVLPGAKTPVWGCSCGESANWASRLKCKTCGRAAPQTVADKAKAASKQTQAAPPDPATRRPVAESKELWQLKERLRKLELSAREDASTAQAGRGSKPERAGRGTTPADHGARNSSARAGAPGAKPEKRLAAQCASLQRELAEAKKRLAAANPATAPAAGAADVPMESEAASGWACTRCGALHSRCKKQTCRICSQRRAAASAPVATPAARSPEEIATERAKLLTTKDALTTGGILDPATLAAALKGIEAKLLRLDEPPAEPEVKDPFKLLDEAKLADDKARLQCEGLNDKATEIKGRMASLQLDLDAVACAITHAASVREQTNAALVAATAALPTSKPHAEAVPGGPAEREAGFTAPSIQSIVNMITTELAQGSGEVQKVAFLQNMLAMIAGVTSQPREPVPPPAAQHQGPPPAAGEPAASPAPAAPPCVTPAPAATAPRVVGNDGLRVAPRATIKAATLEAASNTNAVIEQAQQLQRKEERERRLAAGREDDGLDGLPDAEARA